MFGWLIFMALIVWGIVHEIRKERRYQAWAAQRDRENDHNAPSDGL